MDERRVSDLFDTLELLHQVGALDPMEVAARDAAASRGCANYWPRRDGPAGPAGRWRVGACALRPGCTDLSCLWLRT